MSRKFMSGAWAQKDVKDVSYIWQRQASSQGYSGSGGAGSHVGVIWGYADACRMKQWEIPLFIPIWDLVFWNFFSYVITLMLLIFVNNDFEIMTQKGQRKRHQIWIIASRTGDRLHMKKMEIEGFSKGSALGVWKCFTDKVRKRSQFWEGWPQIWIIWIWDDIRKAKWSYLVGSQGRVKAEDIDLFSFSLFPRSFILPPPFTFFSFKYSYHIFPEPSRHLQSQHASSLLYVALSLPQTW